MEAVDWRCGGAEVKPSNLDVALGLLLVARQQWREFPARWLLLFWLGMLCLAHFSRGLHALCWRWL